MKRSQQPRTIEQEIVFKIKVLCFRKAINPLIHRFDAEAQVLYSGWISKPKAERGVVPERTRQTSRTVTSKERVELLKCLLSILTEEYDVTMTPKSKKHPLAPGKSKRLL